ncbi:MAG: SPASM domain-containing protein [Acidobacteria bacterium]|nr:SPASM domain-containing protein [Acidobacteriota bacterium]
MCPRFSSEDPHLDMSWETYLRIHEAMEYAHTVDFTGWGEPMLHRRIFEMIRLAADRGCLTTMTTNGTVLTEKNCQALIEAGLGRLAVSIDGMTPSTFDAIRTGAQFEKVTENLQRLSVQVQERRSPLELAIAFTIQQSNAGELDLILPWMKKVGACVLHLKHLNVISTPADWQKSFLRLALEPGNDASMLLEVEERIVRLCNKAESEGIRAVMHSEWPLTPQKVGRHCLATPLNSVYFSYEGKMAPCCHFGHHVSRYFEGRLYPPSSLFFGDIRKQAFLNIWGDPSFQEFRKGFMTGVFPKACRTCHLLYGK